MQSVPPCSAPTCLWWLRLLGVAVRHVICGFYLFFLPVMLPSEIPKLPTDPPSESVSWCLETPPLLRLPSRDGFLSLPLSSLFLSFIFCPTSFQRQWAAFLGAHCPLPAFNCFVEFAQSSNVLSINLWGRKWSACPIPPPSSEPLIYSSVLNV